QRRQPEAHLARPRQGARAQDIHPQGEASRVVPRLCGPRQEAVARRRRHCGADEEDCAARGQAQQRRRRQAHRPGRRHQDHRH
ncbi:hypothetical protein BN1708_017850, partial [Verticillium longisporum]